MEIESAARDISERTTIQPYRVQKLKNVMTASYPQFAQVPDWQKWRLLEEWIAASATLGEEFEQVADKSWRNRTKITQKVLDLKSEGIPPDAVLMYRGLLWDYLNRGEFSNDPALENKMRDHLRCWDEWAAESKKQLDLMAKADRYFWFGFLPSMLVFLWCMTVGERRISRKRKFMDIANARLDDHKKDGVHPKAVQATLEMMKYVRGE